MSIRQRQPLYYAKSISSTDEPQSLNTDGRVRNLQSYNNEPRSPKPQWQPRRSIACQGGKQHLNILFAGQNIVEKQVKDAEERE